MVSLAPLQDKLLMAIKLNLFYSVVATELVNGFQMQ